MKLAPWAASSNGQVIPVIHNITANFDNCHSYELKSARWQEMHAWCRENCRDRFYGSPGWTDVWGFEDDEDATAFALLWA